MVSSSVTVREVGENTMPDVSSSSMLMVAWFGVPVVTPASGMVPKPSSTLSLSSSNVSSVAANVIVLEVSPASKVTDAGAE